MTATYVPGKGILAVFPGMSVMLPSHMTISALERHVRELEDWLSD